MKNVKMVDYNNQNEKMKFQMKFGKGSIRVPIWNLTQNPCQSSEGDPT